MTTHKLNKSSKLNSKYTSKPKSPKLSGIVKQARVTYKYDPIKAHAWGVQRRAEINAHLLKLGRAAFA